MHYYVLRVVPRKEEEIIRQSKEFFSHRSERLIYLQKIVPEKKAGKTIQAQRPLFPGYLFLEASENPREIYWHLKGFTNFLHFLRAENQFQTLDSKDEGLLKHFLNYGEVLEISAVKFNQEDRIQVIHGPMQGLEGKITRVDKRKKRAKILVELEGQAFHIDLPYRLLEIAPEQGQGK